MIRSYRAGNLMFGDALSTSCLVSYNLFCGHDCAGLGRAGQGRAVQGRAGQGRGMQIRVRKCMA